MPSTSDPAEQRRLAQLQALKVLDSEPEPLFDTLAQLASEVCGTPIALVSLIDTDRQWFKANVGLPGVGQTPRDVAFCDHAIRQDGLFEVGDATRDRRFEANPLVTGQPGVRFYAGAPLVLPSGDRIGTLCVIDRQPRQLAPQQAAMLTQLAQAVVQALELRQSLVLRTLAVRHADDLAVAESEARLRAILDTQSELVSQATPDGRLLYVNPAYAAYFSRSVEEITGTNLYEHVDPAVRGLVRERIAQVLSQGKPVTSENRMSLPDGSECWIAWTNTRQFDLEGRPLLHSTGRDVTARVLAERKLRTSQAFLARTGEVAGVGGWALDLRTSEITWSDETYRIHELSPGFKPTLEAAISFYTPASRVRIEQAVAEGMAHGTPWDLELQVVTAKGRTIWARAVGAVEFEDGQAVRLIGAFQDITEQRRLREQLATSEQFLRQLTDGVPVRLAYLDRERRYRFVNEAWCQGTGLSREEVIGKTRARVLPGQDREELRHHAALALSGQSVQFETDDTVAGQVRRFEHRLKPDVDEHGQVRGFFVSATDITERSAAEKAHREIAAIFEHTTDYVVQFDLAGQILYLNPAMREVGGWSADAASGSQTFEQLLSDEARDLFRSTILPALLQDDVWLGSTTIRLDGRRELPVSLMVIAHRSVDTRHGRSVERYSALMRDETASMAAQAEIRRQSAILKSVADAIPSTVAVMGQDGQYRFVNRAFERAVGRDTAGILGHGAREILGEEEFERRRPWIEMALQGVPVTFELEQVGEHGKTYTQVEYLPLLRPSGEVDSFVVVTQDITQRKREELRLLTLTQTDALTGLLNRTGFRMRLENMLDEHVGESIGLLYVDLDRFKPVNDTHGHAAGDAVLKDVARRLTRLMRPTDAVARLGGDEFAVLLHGVTQVAQAERVAAKIVEALKEPFDLGPDRIAHIGASVGGAFGHAVIGDWPALLEKADQMLYQAKAEGRGRYLVAVLAGPGA
ncbi:PAS domain S-box protein [Leptothrix discophora]|uniref:PAS domain S-box protein n=1 Tax=Leptothrix discophora TaxID=89 RepID=A0ABT9G2P6_LEPDI|nr:PAS domain S-box protein [Leptothrix discophora]MDP4300686.1 PAS domain S-box protein [Leptothrix discophora]